MNSINAKDQLTPEMENYCRQLYTAATDAFSLLLNNPILNAHKPGADSSLIDAVAAAEQIDTSLNEYTPQRMTIKPRSLRDEDYRKLSRGEHAGVTVEYADAAETIVRINFFGGLRDPNYHEDIRDTDQSFKNTHASRTLATASKPTEIGLQMQRSGSRDLDFDAWFKVTPKGLTISSFIFETEKYDLMSSVTNEPGNGNTILNVLSQLHQAFGFFVQVVDNPASPRAS